MRNLRNRDGFTLIELMIVVVIIGILAAIAIPKFSSVSQNAKQSEAGPILKQICTLQGTQFEETGSYATKLENLKGYTDVKAKYFTFSTTGNNAVADPNDLGKAAKLSKISRDCTDGKDTETVTPSSAMREAPACDRCDLV